MRSATEIDVRADDALLVAVKGQDTDTALQDLRADGIQNQPIFCAQNGGVNERAALRLFPNVHGINVMLPAQYTAPGETIAWCRPNYGIFDIGRFPSGFVEADEALAKALTSAGIGGFAQEDVMAYKYGKLTVNLGNIIEAALARDAETADISDIPRKEGAAVLQAAGIWWRDVWGTGPRRELINSKTVQGVDRIGSSTSQSLARADGSVEADFLNGEICYLGRLHGVPTPGNDFVTRLAARLARDKMLTGTIAQADMVRGLSQ